MGKACEGEGLHKLGDGHGNCYGELGERKAPL